MLCPPDYVNTVLKLLTENGYTAHLVGGCVRDAIMGRPVHDWDVATSASPSTTAKLFKETAASGKKFGTVTAIQPGGTVEVTTYRTESAYTDSRHPESVRFINDLNEDLRRRDFTINAMAVTIEGRIIDLFDGQKDITDRIIRCVGDPELRLSEDALRMFRAFRFSAELGFGIEQNTLEAIIDNAEKAQLISAERIRVELEKTLLSQRPETAGEMINAGLLDKYLLSRGTNAINKRSIPLFTASLFNNLPVTPALRWCAFCAILLDNGLIATAAGFLRALRLDNKTIKAITTALSIPTFPGDAVSIKRLFARHGTLAVRCAAAAQDTLCEQKGSPSVYGPCLLRLTDTVIASGECFSLQDLAVKGNDLISAGYPEGARLGEALDTLLDHVVEHPEDNIRGVLMNLIRRLSW